MAASKITLPLVRHVPDHRMTPFLWVQLLWTMIPQLLFFIPLQLLYHHVLFRWRSRVVQEIGRSALSDFFIRFGRCFFSRGMPAQQRVLYSRDASYRRVFSGPRFKGFEEWAGELIEVNGTRGRWLAPPGTDRKDDKVVIYNLHGGGFTRVTTFFEHPISDTGAGCQDFLLQVLKKLNLEFDIQASAFSLDYHLAPEYIYPSQLIETLAGYHYLVQTLGISEKRICLMGDSAGGNLAAGFLLHLARPAREITVPAALGKTPGRPGQAIGGLISHPPRAERSQAALLISPFVALISRSRSTALHGPFDLFDCSLPYRLSSDYVGALPLPSAPFRTPSLNPLTCWIGAAGRMPPRNLLEGEPASEEIQQWRETKGAEAYASPYANPSMCKDDAWWSEACPPEGKTLVSWGGKEIFADDCEAFYHTLAKAGVAPTKLYKQYGVHNFVLFDWPVLLRAPYSPDVGLGPGASLQNIPNSHRTHTPGPAGKLTYALEATLAVLERLAADE
ncbi:SPOSA6832_02918, partial [Sporobolomyces salmonicolor]